MFLLVTLMSEKLHQVIIFNKLYHPSVLGDEFWLRKSFCKAVIDFCRRYAATDKIKPLWMSWRVSELVAASNETLGLSQIKRFSAVHSKCGVVASMLTWPNHDRPNRHYRRPHHQVIIITAISKVEKFAVCRGCDVFIVPRSILVPFWEHSNSALHLLLSVSALHTLKISVLYRSMPREHESTLTKTFKQQEVKTSILLYKTGGSSRRIKIWISALTQTLSSSFQLKLLIK